MSLGTMEQRTEGMKRQAAELIEQAYNRGFKAGYDKAFATLNENWQLVTSEAEEKGRNEAWEAAGKLVSMEYWKCNEVLDDGVLTIETDEEIFTRCTASEAIEKIRAYEAQKQEEDERIEVGDEVVFHNEDRPDTVMFVMKVAEDGFIDGMDAKGNLYAEKNPKNWTKTGRHLNEIAEVLKKMQEGENHV